MDAIQLLLIDWVSIKCKLISETSGDMSSGYWRILNSLITWCEELNIEYKGIEFYFDTIYIDSMFDWDYDKRIEYINSEKENKNE